MIDGKDKARIEAAIRVFDKHSWDRKRAADQRTEPCWPPLSRLELRMAGEWKRLADLLRYFLGQEQETWKDEDFGLGKETPNQKGG